jgi:hypothetical protein
MYPAMPIAFSSSTVTSIIVRSLTASSGMVNASVSGTPPAASKA